MTDELDPKQCPSVWQPGERLTNGFEDLGVHGVLWIINRVIFHPRGFALAVDYAEPGSRHVAGWSILGDGSEPWRFDESIDEDAKFAAFEALLDACRQAGSTPE